MHCRHTHEPQQSLRLLNVRTLKTVFIIVLGFKLNIKPELHLNSNRDEVILHPIIYFIVVYNTYIKHVQFLKRLII
jgi:hypothetical protein